jgi:hypothetical protein
MDAITAHQCHPSVIRASSEYLAWKESVLTRDHNICQLCGATEGLHVHHRVPISVNPSLATNIDNGITVCETCHHNIHRKKGYTRRTGMPTPKAHRIKEYKTLVDTLRSDIINLHTALAKERECSKIEHRKFLSYSDLLGKADADTERYKSLCDHYKKEIEYYKKHYAPKWALDIAQKPPEPERKPGLFKRLFSTH